jgi:hypothetical protein
MDSDGCFDHKKFKKISAGLGYPELSANELKILNVFHIIICKRTALI